ncbi:MAG: IPT/TIG domain-containing protein [Acidobacteriia bacterium]|nr:IPT/TIG domain-containing protein [Terriglobia bacterium]
MLKLRIPILFLALTFLTCQYSLGQTAERYVVLEPTSSRAHVFNVADDLEIASIQTATSANSIAISPNGRLAFVAGLNGQFVSVIDLTIQAEIKRIRGIRADQIAISPDGKKVVVTDVEDELIKVIDASTLSVMQQISLNGLAGDDPNSLDLFFNNPVISGNKVYLNTSSDIVSVDLTTGAVTPLSGPDDFFFFQSAENAAVTPDGKSLLAIRLNGLVVIDTATSSTVTTIPFIFAFGVAAAPHPTDPSKVVALVMNFGPVGQTLLSMIDVTQGSITFGQTLGEVSMPAGVPIGQNTMVTSNGQGTRAYVNTSNANVNPNLIVVDTAAMLTNPAGAIVHQGLVGQSARAVAVGITQTQPLATAPVIQGVNEKQIKNDKSKTIRITGAGFASDAVVRIGNMDPLTPDAVTSSALRVTVPANAPSGTFAIVVTNPNSAQDVSQQQQSGILLNALSIATPPNFKPTHQVALTNFGTSTLSVLHIVKDDTNTPQFATGPRPIGLALSPDGTRAYIAPVFPPAAVDVFNFNTHSIEAHIVLNGQANSRPGQAKAIVLAPRLATGKLAAYVVASKRRGLDLYAIDADPTSPTFNQVVDDIPTGIITASALPGSFAMTPDGRFAFINELDNSGGSNFVVINIATRTITSIPSTTLGFAFFEPTMELSADGRLIVLGGDDGALRVFDVGTNPTAPSLVATLHGTSPAGLPQVFLGFPRIVGNRLFSFDLNTNIVNIFNFNPAANDFSELANFAIPGPTTDLEVVFDVTSDGLLYVPIREEDSVAILDVEKIVRHDPDALITKIGVGLAPTYAVIRPE